VVGFALDDAPQGQDQLGLAMRVNGHLQPRGDHVDADGNDRARHVLERESRASGGVDVLFQVTIERHGG
jgi:hypothetical protein